MKKTDSLELCKIFLTDEIDDSILQHTNVSVTKRQGCDSKWQCLVKENVTNSEKSAQFM